MGTDPTSPAADGSGPGIATIAGILAFLAGGVATVVAAVGDIGADDSALAAARRNHPSLLIAAAAAAAFGLFVGAVYTIARSAFPPTTSGRRGAVLAFVLGLGVLSTVAGVVMGATATADRKPGHPAIKVTRLDDATVRVHVTGDGLPSNDTYNMEIDGYGERAASDPGPYTELLAARFSPGQDGKLDWTEEVNVSPSTTAQTISRILVWITREVKWSRPTRDCNGGAAVTCSYVRVPAKAAAASTG